jgi:hypothetical protein
MFQVWGGVGNMAGRQLENFYVNEEKIGRYHFFDGVD